jgi:hypothetical protein
LAYFLVDELVWGGRDFNVFDLVGDDGGFDFA